MKISPIIEYIHLFCGVTMLVRFNVKNFLSFSTRNDPDTGKPVSNEFSMIPGKVRSKMEHIQQHPKQDLLKFAAIYGANASGKSNLIKALDFMQQTVRSGTIPTNSTEKYSKTNSEHRTDPTYFSIELLLDSRCYEYGFEVILQTGQIVSEWLFELGKENQKRLFEKETGKEKYLFENDLRNISNLAMYAKDMSGSDILFLTLMNQNKTGFYQNNPNARVLNEVYSWFVESLDINYPDRPISDFSYLTDIGNIPEVSRLISAFGTGIATITPIEIPVEKMFSVLPTHVKKDISIQIDAVTKAINLFRENSHGRKIDKWTALVRSPGQLFTLEIDKDLKQKAHEIKFVHQDKDFSFDFSEESDGTVRLFDLIEMLVSNKNKTYVIDELDRCMHPCLTYKFVETFLSYAQSRKVQLIVTSHESRLLDFDLLRRDEVWFVDKDNKGESTLYSLEEYNVRFDQKVDKAYLEGRYGGVPVFTTLFPIEKEKK